MEVDPLDELNRMANAAAQLKTNTPPEQEEIDRWMHLFKYSKPEAKSLIAAQRADITRDPITDSHWALISANAEASGHSSESYEHLLSLKDLLKSQSSTIYDKEGVRWTLFRLGGLLESAEKVREITGREEVPRVSEGMGEMRYADFVWVDDGGKKMIEEWIGGMVVLR